jgi:uncharacterized protein
MHYDVEKLKKLNSILKELRNIVVAFSGGVDSSFLVYAAHRLPECKVTAVTITAPYIPQWEINEAKDFADRYGIRHYLLQLDIPKTVAENTKERCYICKSILFSKLRAFAEDHNAALVEGTNNDDTSDHRPGLRALKELSIRSPLLEAGLTKDDIRAISKEWQLPTHNKPAYACLLTRIPFDTTVTPQILQMIETAETSLIKLGFRAVRVRHHGDLARIELPPQELEQALKHRMEILDTVKGAGYRFVALDLEGYRMGSFNS